MNIGSDSEIAMSGMAICCHTQNCNEFFILFFHWEEINCLKTGQGQMPKCVCVIIQLIHVKPMLGCVLVYVCVCVCVCKRGVCVCKYVCV